MARQVRHQPTKGLDNRLAEPKLRKSGFYSTRLAVNDTGTKGFNVDLTEIDRLISTFMRHWGILALRISMGIIFVWFGILKPLGLSPAEPLVIATTRWLPLLDGKSWVIVIGWWEVAIGIAFVFRRMIRVAIALLALQIVGTFMPLILLPGVTFQAGHFPYAPTMEGQYIIKNLLIISAALVVGGTVRRSEETA